MIFATPVRFDGKVKYKMQAVDKEEAIDIANDRASDDNFGDLSDIDWETLDAYRDPEGGECDYIVTMIVTGRIEFNIQANSEKEAMTKAEDLAVEADCGEMEDIEWEVKRPTMSYSE